VRPANYPRLRLQQYQAWVSRQPEWPEILRQIMPAIPPGLTSASPTPLARKEAGLSALRETLAWQVMGDAIGGSRLDTMICDGFLPLAAVATGRDLLPVWFHWYLGDVPGEVRRALRETGIAGPGATPYCHGWGQGLLGWLIDREARASS
jgi:hypothetical protein